MGIPKIVHKNNHTYTFVKQCNKDIFLYESELGFKETFDRFDLGVLNNAKLDKQIGRRTWEEANYIVYDRLLNKETEYPKIADAAEALGVPPGTISDRIRNHRWLHNRWFIERRYKD